MQEAVVSISGGFDIKTLLFKFIKSRTLDEEAVHSGRTKDVPAFF